MVLRYAHHQSESLRGGAEVLDRLRRENSTKLAQWGGVNPSVALIVEHLVFDSQWLFPPWLKCFLRLKSKAVPGKHEERSRDSRDLTRPSQDIFAGTTERRDPWGI